ncbi:MAG: acyl carrier protein [Pseudonocardiaceae bacterium]
MNTSKASPAPASPAEASSAVILRELGSMLREVLGDYELGEDVEITADTKFFGDLELESIDLVVLAGHVEARYGSGVNIAEFIATLEFDEIIGLTLGRLVDYVADCQVMTRGLEPSAPNTGTTQL